MITDEEIIAYLDGEENPRLTLLLKSDPDLRKKTEDYRELLFALGDKTSVLPSPEVYSSFQSALEKEMLKKSPVLSQGLFLKIAAGLLLLITGFLAGNFTSDRSYRQDLSDLNREIRSLQQVVMASRLENPTASERIKAVNQITELPAVDEKLIKTLFTSLNNDQSPNVRYAALQALAAHSHLPTVRMGLVNSMQRQHDPLIQVALIGILTRTGDKNAIAPMQQLLEKEDTPETVREQARLAIDILT